MRSREMPAFGKWSVVRGSGNEARTTDRSSKKHSKSPEVGNHGGEATNLRCPKEPNFALK